jgi:DNA-binding transcriptional MerR regulator
VTSGCIFLGKVDAVSYTVKTVSQLAGVSIRTLHHYDAIGLLKPAGVTAAGYRLYSDADLRRLQQILFFREMEVGLEEIRGILDDPAFDRRAALESHREALVARQRRLRRLLRTIDITLESLKEGTPMEGESMFEGFDPSRYEEEARERWGDTPEWKESRQRTRRYTREDWAAIRKEAGEITGGIAARMAHGPSDPQVQDLVRRYREHISRSYYDCSAEVFRGLADLYLQDARFTASWERIAPGLARFMSEAMRLYCDGLRKAAPRR